MMFFPVSVGVTGWSRVGWTVHSARAVRGGGGVVLADLLQLVPIFIPENGALGVATSGAHAQFRFRMHSVLAY